MAPLPLMQAYTRDPPSAPASRAQFANLLQRKYTTPKAAPPDAPILAPLTPAEQAKNANATIPSDTTKIVDFNAAATPVEALSETPATFRRTFNPHSQSVALHHLPAPVPLPKSPGASSLQPLWSKVSHTGSRVILLHTNPTVLRITKRHRDALKIKLFHLHANILSMNWFYDTID
eukprot:jgi/Psemu1/61680/gm1.61680_g